MKLNRGLVLSVVILAPVALGAAALASALRAGGPRPAAAREPYDIVITGGRLLDGMGNPWFSGDVAIRDGRIAAVGALCGRSGSDCAAKRKIEKPSLN